ncbi:MAG TPA: hypothetical protein VIL95_07915 [Bacillota bacterium]
MAFPQDALNRYVVFPFSKGTSYTPSPGELSNGLLPKSKIITAKVYTYGPTSPHPGAPSSFFPTTREWTFRWLEYVPGATTMCRLQEPVMTGPMSGCLLATYWDGGPRVAHVGTADSGPLTAKAKAAWTNYLALGKQTVARGGYPNRVISDDEVINAYKEYGGEPLRCGYFESPVIAWAVMLVPVPDSKRPPVAKQTFLVHTIKRMPMSPWPAIKEAF